MNSKFIATVIPNGIIKNTKTNAPELQLSVCIDINHDADFSTADNQNEFYRQFINLSDALCAEKPSPTIKLSVNNVDLGTVPLSNNSFWSNCGSENIGELKNARETLWENLFCVICALPANQNIDTKGATRMQVNSTAAVAMLNTNVEVKKNIPVTGIGHIEDSLQDFNDLNTNLAGNKAFDYLLQNRGGLQTYLAVPLSPLSPPPLNIKPIKELLKGNSIAAAKFKEIKKREKIDFITNYLQQPDVLRKLKLDSYDIADSLALASDHYVSNNIDINEIFITFSQLSHHPVLLRLFGLLLDFTIPLDALNPLDKTFIFNLTDIQLGSLSKTDDWVFTTTHVNRIDSNGKSAFLATPNPAGSKCFVNSILEDTGVYMQNFDLLAQNQRLEAVKSRLGQPNADTQGEFHDSFTRGIIYSHKQLNKIIEPEPVTGNNIYEGGISMGQRVAIKTNLSGPEWQSVTERSTTIYSAKNKELYRCAQTESCIHFDHVTNHFDDKTGDVEPKASQALFEYKGEQLTLNTIFSRASKISRLESDNDKLENPPDISLEHSQLRMNNCLDIDYFPYDGKVRPRISPNSLQLRYGLATGERRYVPPTLQFGYNYQFVVYNQYRNGWALPFNNPNEFQLSLTEVLDLNISNNINLLPTFRFKRIENIKPVELFAKKPISENEKDDIANKESLRDLVVAEGKTDYSRQRHILPPRISLEHAFWFGLLFQMPLADSYLWKRCYNCAFQDKTKFKSPCDEGCTAYCGGTVMEKNYDQDFISAYEVKYIPDPLVTGFTIQLYWDINCSATYIISSAAATCHFNKTNDYTVSGYAIKVEMLDHSSLSNKHMPQVSLDDANSTLTIWLPRGRKVYAKLHSHMNGKLQKNDHWEHDFWINQLYGRNGMAPVNAKSFGNGPTDNPKNQPVQISLTCAHITPLLKPDILAMSSVANDFAAPKQILNFSYIDNWIKLCKSRYDIPDLASRLAYNYLFQGDNILFETAKNIITTRPQNADNLTEGNINSSKITVNLMALFERLDAYDVDQFIPDVTPTGGLELWMQREEFIDDAGKFVVEEQDSPDKPIQTFDEQIIYGPNNKKQPKCDLDYKIDFTPQILTQLKLQFPLLNNVTKVGGPKITKPAEETQSRMALCFDAKSTKFEVRKYTLRDISKYKGYYTTDQVAAGPKAPGAKYGYDDFYFNSELFPVIILNNTKPDKPEIAYLVTTIREIRTLYKHITESIQKGNIVTVYLKRGRLSSGRDERVGMLIKNYKAYSAVFDSKEQLSLAGADKLSDLHGAKSKWIEPGNVIIPAPEENIYDAQYDPELGMVHYLPQFDIDKQLWKFEIELDISTAEGHNLHNPFVNLALVHYQPFSINYNTNITTPDISADCRLSEPETSGWCYLLPERKTTVTFKKPGIFSHQGSVDVALVFHYESLHHHVKDNNSTIRSNFVFCIEGSLDGMNWFPVQSLVLKKNADDTDFWRLMQPLLDADVHYPASGKGHVLAEKKVIFSRTPFPKPGNEAVSNHKIKCRKFRVRITEVEWFSEKTWDDLLKDNNYFILKDTLDTEGLRTRYIEIIN